jgi:Flp pilus assembly protein TadD
VRVELSRILAAGGDVNGAVAAATEAMRLAPADPVPGEQLASVLADAGDATRLTPLADALRAKFPERDEPAYYHATALFMQGRTAEAADETRRLLARNPRHARAQNLLGATCATLGDRDCAHAAFEASLAANPRDPVTYVNLGLFYLQGGDPARAAGYFAEALAIDPTSAGARNGLAQVRVAKP